MDDVKILDRNKVFWEELATNLSRKDLIDLVKMQDMDLYEGVRRIEWVFENKLGHLTWDDGTPITQRKMTNEELALLIDPPFEISETLARVGLSVEQQRQFHIASDPVTWSKHFLGAKPRVYQILILRHGSDRKVLRAGRRLGKALAIDTPIPTPSGWTTMAKLEVGDQVFDDSGKPANVTFVTDTQLDRRCFKVNFSDGNHLIADADHQWTVDTWASRSNEDVKDITLTTAEMIDHLYVSDGEDKSFNYSIDCALPVQYEEKELAVSPYIFGAAMAKGPMFNNIADEEEEFELGIPREYLEGSIEQRAELLNGIVSTAGDVDHLRRCEYKTTNGHFALCVYELVQSLGCAATYSFRDDEHVIRFIHKPFIEVQKRYVVSIEEVESVPVKCISVDSPRSLYLAGDSFIPTHNTFSMAFMLLHRSYTIEGHKSLVIAPMKAHVKVIFDTCLELARNNPVVSESITRAAENPQHSIEFSNGSTVRLFTSGMKSGGRSDSARGQEAHMIILDEMDYLADEDLDALYAMLQKTSEDQVDKLMLGASTPTGRKSTFWEWCHKPDTFKEFWFPSYTNPFFTQEVEDEQREINSEMAYRHEIEADWGEDTEGVFPRRYVDAAFIHPNWEYLQEARTLNDTDYVIGVDWNKYDAGVSIVVLERMLGNYPEGIFKGKSKLVYREEVNREDYTLLAAVQRIVELNAIFNPSHIYVDKGFGEVQMELLHKYGVENPATGLHTKVKGVGFGESIEVRDPYLGSIERKDVKPFLMDNLRRMFEQGTIFFPGRNPDKEEFDSNFDDELHFELISYVVSRVTPTGRPVFEAAGSAKDHNIDALALAAFAISENFSDLMKITYDSTIRHVSSSAISSLVDVPDYDKEKMDLIEEVRENGAPLPIKQQRPMFGGVRSGRGSISRKMF